MLVELKDAKKVLLLMLCRYDFVITMITVTACI